MAQGDRTVVFSEREHELISSVMTEYEFSNEGWSSPLTIELVKCVRLKLANAPVEP